MRRYLYALLLLLCFSLPGSAQSLLNRVLSISASREPLPEVLNRIGLAGHFRFSYNSDMVGNRKISIQAEQKTVRQILDQLFEGQYHYTEQGNYIILHAGAERSFTISGYIRNGRTGAHISHATIYEHRLLAAAQTNEQGYFRLQLKNKDRYKTVSITVSKEHYSNLSLDLDAGYDQELILPIVPDTEIVLNDIRINKDRIESTWAGRLFLSSKQKMQALNIGRFITERPVQSSLIPGIGTHGSIGAHVVNKFSLNMLGGYTAGVQGAEIGGLFNINRNHVYGVQAAGLFNNVGGKTAGFQLSGIFNNVLGQSAGLQAAGIGNRVNNTFKGVQLAGIGNYTTGAMQGVQAAGLLNRNDSAAGGILLSGLINDVRGPTRGIQAAGLMNRNRGSMRGIQISGLANYARKLNGLQVGVINISDTLEGYCIGLFNYSRNGYHQLSIGINELQLLQLGYRSGRPALYTVWQLGSSMDVSQKMYMVGYGLGTAQRLGQQLSIATELSVSGYYLGDFHHMPVAARLQSALVYKPTPFLSFFAGPAYTISSYQNAASVNGYLSAVYQEQRMGFHSSRDFTGWIGWQAGVYLF